MSLEFDLFHGRVYTHEVEFHRNSHHVAWLDEYTLELFIPHVLEHDKVVAKGLI